MSANAVYSIIDRYRKNPRRLTFDSSHIIAQIKNFVDRGEPVVILFPGCHGKLNNPELTLNHKPDLSEFLCIQSLNNLVAEIKAVYPPGARIILVHEGHFYVDTPLIESDQSMDEYLVAVRRQLGDTDHFESMTLRDFFPDISSNEECRRTFFEKYCPSRDELHRIVDGDPLFAKRKNHYLQMLKDSFHYATDKAADVADQQLQIWIGFRRLLKHHFAGIETVRFSTVYKEPAESEYVAVNYIPFDHLEMPSAHCVVHFHDGSYRYMTRKQAEALHYELADHQGFKYFEAKGVANGPQ